MSNSWHVSRRTLLRGVGAAVSLPLLEVMVDRAACANSQRKPPNRMAYLYIPNGVADGAWQPKSVAEDGKIEELNPWMKPLKEYQSELTIFRNLWTPRGNGHIAGTATWLTGGRFNGEKIDAGGISVDQFAAREIGAETLLPSLEMSAKGEGIFTSSLPRNALSWLDPKTPAARDIEPRIIFDRMFRVGNSGLANRSVLDLVRSDARRMERRISIQDRRKLDEYLSSIRAIERRIEFAEKQKGRADANPLLRKAMVRPESGIPEDHGEYMRQMMDMIVLAFWSDATRVATFMMDHGQSNRYFDFIDGVKGTWHALSHWKDISGKTEDDDGKTSWASRDEKRMMYNRVTQWHTELVAYLLGRLKAIEENGGNLLDNSMIVYGSSLADGHEHAERNLPILVAGKGGGTIRSGQAIRFRSEQSMSGLHLALLQRLGINTDRFADASEPIELA